MKTSKTFDATFKNNSDYGTFDWQTIMSEAAAYKFVVMYRSHERGNGKGEYFSTSDFERLFKEQDFWFFNCERPVWQVILTDEDVPSIIAQRRELIDKIQRVEFDIHYLHIPMRPNCDGRATRRTQPEAFAEWDKAKAKAERKMKTLRNKRDNLRKELEAVQPYFSTTLYNISRQK